MTVGAVLFELGRLWAFSCCPKFSWGVLWVFWGGLGVGERATILWILRVKHEGHVWEVSCCPHAREQQSETRGEGSELQLPCITAAGVGTMKLMHGQE